MPAVSETSARAPSHTQATGIRPHAGADKASTPFSDLLDSCEASDTNAQDQAAKSAESARTETAPQEGKADKTAGKPEEASKTTESKAAAGTEPEPALPIVAVGQQPAPEGENKGQPVAAISPEVEVSPEEAVDAPADGDATKTDASDVDAGNTSVVATPAAPPQLVPVPVSAPASPPAPAAAAEVPTAEVTAIPTVPTPADAGAAAPETTETVASIPATPTPVATEAKPVVSPAVTAHAAKPEVTAKTGKADKTGEPAKADTADTAEKSEQIDKADKTETTAKTDKPEKTEKSNQTEKSDKVDAAKGKPADINLSDIESTAEPAKTADVKGETASDNGAATEPAADTEGTQKPATRQTDAAANVLQNDAGTLDAKPKMTIAQAPPDAAPNSALPAPVIAGTNPGATQVAQPSAQQPAHMEMVPLAGLAVEIAAHAHNGKNHFEIRLDPPELGRIDVQLHIDGDGQVTSHLRVERAETLDLLRRDAQSLERTLQQAGLKTSDGSLQFSLRDQSFSQQQHQGRETPVTARIVVPDEIIVPAETQRHYGRLAGLGSGVDIRV